MSESRPPAWAEALHSVNVLTVPVCLHLLGEVCLWQTRPLTLGYV